MSDNPDPNKPKDVSFDLTPFAAEEVENMKPPSPTADVAKRSRAESFAMAKSPPRPKSRARVPNPLDPSGKESESNPAFARFKVSVQEASEAIGRSHAKSREAADAFAELKAKSQESEASLDEFEGNFQEAEVAFRQSYPNLQEADGVIHPMGSLDAAFARFDANSKAIAERRAGWQESAQARAAAMEATAHKAMEHARAQLKADVEAHSAAQRKLEEEDA